MGLTDASGRDQHCAGAEGATAPESLRQKDRAQTALWKADALKARLTEGVDPAGPGEISQVP